MKMSCLFGRHWPAAAFVPNNEGIRTSVCIDCGCAMAKGARNSWRAAPRAITLDALFARWNGLRGSTN
jgi:hypothetical protein